MSPDLRIGLTIGLMGGFTTFSTFGWDTVRMLEEGEWTKASLYVGERVWRTHCHDAGDARGRRPVRPL